MARRMFFLGVDLGGGKGKNTALAVLRCNEPTGARAGAEVVEVVPGEGDRPLYDAALVERLLGAPDPAVLGIDAPLTLPPCLRCEVPVCPGALACVDPAVVEMHRLVREASGARDVSGATKPSRSVGRSARRGKPEITPYTQRACEVALHLEGGILPRETLGQGMGPLTARAAHLRRALAGRFRLNENLIEVYPKATLLRLGFTARYKRHLHERRRRAEVLQLLGDLERPHPLRFAPGVWREGSIANDHAFDAVIAAYTAYLWHAQGWKLPPGREGVYRVDGYIWAPEGTPR